MLGEGEGGGEGGGGADPEPGQPHLGEEVVRLEWEVGGRAGQQERDQDDEVAGRGDELRGESVMCTVGSYKRLNL